MTHPTDVDVLIVGAGPTGLTLACLLAQFGVKFRIIEKNKTITEQSKALVVQARTLELFEQLELTEKAIALGHPAEGLDLVTRGKVRASVDLREYGKGLTKYPYMLVLEQSKTEQLLLDRLESLGKSVEWQCELVDLVQYHDSVSATMTTNSHIETISAKYLVAADGPHSAVRTYLHLPFEGGSFENRFLLADVQIQGKISQRHISLCFSQRGFATFFPMYGTDRFRTISLLPEDLGSRQVESFDLIASEIQRQSQLPLRISNPCWYTTYRLHHRSIMHFKEQRCFFAGDSAHIHSPAGGQGMNTGIQDAFNLGWKLAYVLSGRGKESLLETYHEERYSASRKMIHATDHVFSLFTDNRSFLLWCRLFLAPIVIKLASKLDFIVAATFRFISQIDVAYPESSLNEQGFPAKGVLRAGDRFWNGTCQDGMFHAFLVGELSAQMQIMDILENFFENRIKFTTLDRRPDLQSILLAFGIFRDGLILVRPDGYVCYCAEGLDANALLKYLNRFYIEKGTRQEKRPEKVDGFPFESFI